MSTESRPENTSNDDRLEHEFELWERYSHGDECAREELILTYRPMVYWLAKKLRIHYSVYPDLISEGTIALINSVDAFDPGRNNRFSTYAYYKIRGRMINYLQRVEAKAPLPLEDSLFENISSGAQDVLAGADRCEWTMDLEQAMSVLSEREAGILNALIVEGRMAKEVADDIKIDVSHLYRIRRKALEKLRRWFHDATSAV